MAAAAIPYVIAGLSALGGLFGNRKSTQTSTLKGTQATDRTTTQMPTYAPWQLAMRDSLMNTFLGRLGPQYAQNLAGDITTGNIQNINRGAMAGQRALQESLAARGMNYGPLGSVLGNEMNAGRIGNIVQALNQRKILAEQIQSGALANASDFFTKLPVGSTGTDRGTVTTDQTQTGTQPGNMLGGLLGGLGTSLAGMYGLTGGFGQYPQYRGLNISGGPGFVAGELYPGSNMPIQFPGFPGVNLMQGSLLNSLLGAFMRRR